MNIPKPGIEVTFTDGGNVYDGVCTGEAIAFDPHVPETLTHIPVYVQDTDKHIVVALGNLVDLSNVDDLLA